MKVDHNTPNAQKHKVIDLHTGQEIIDIHSADDEFGEYYVYETAWDGQAIRDQRGKVKIEKKQGNIKIIPPDEEKDGTG